MEFISMQGLSFVHLEQFPQEDGYYFVINGQMYLAIARYNDGKWFLIDREIPLSSDRFWISGIKNINGIKG